MSISPQGSSSTPVTLQIQLQRADSRPDTPKPPIQATMPDQFKLAQSLSYTALPKQPPTVMPSVSYSTTSLQASHSTEHPQNKKTPFPILPILTGVVITLGVGFLLWRSRERNLESVVPNTKSFDFTEIKESLPQEQEAFIKLCEALHVNNDENRLRLCKNASEITGLTFYDVGNLTLNELKETLKMWVRNHFEPIKHAKQKPNNIQHVVFGHGFGSDKNWRFVGTEQLVSEYCNRVIPPNTKVWLQVCRSDFKPVLTLLEGHYYHT